MLPRIRIVKILLFCLCLLLINIATVLLGDEESRLTVVNKTEHYLHIFIDEQPYLYIAPDRSVTHSAGAKASMSVSVVYAPGQGIDGSRTETVTLPYRSASEYCDCSDEDAFGDCVVTPSSGGSSRWEVTPADLTTD